MAMFFEKNLDIKLGSLSLSLVPQAKIALIGYSVLALSMLLMSIALHRLTKGVKPLAVLGGIIYFAAIFALGLYNLNCTVVGKCNMFAWIISGFVGVTAIYMLFASAAALYASMRA